LLQADLVEQLKNPQENHFFFSQNKIAEPLKDIISLL
jgi:hypothetical protein